MVIDQTKFYICWSPRILPIILDAGYELWVDPNGKQENPYLDLIKRYDKDGNPIAKPKTGYIFERTPALMELIARHSKTNI